LYWRNRKTKRKKAKRVINQNNLNNYLRALLLSIYTNFPCLKLKKRFSNSVKKKSKNRKKVGLVATRCNSQHNKKNKLKNY
jgi:hypothetical protein